MPENKKNIPSTPQDTPKGKEKEIKESPQGKNNGEAGEREEKKEKHPGGRPLKFKSAEELQAKIDEYFKRCEERTGIFISKEGKKIEIPSPIIPTIAGLAYAVGVDRQTIYNYAEKDEFFDTIKNARDYIISLIESKLVNTNSNAGGIIFLAKNYGYQDKQEVEHTGDINISVNGIKRL